MEYSGTGGVWWRKPGAERKQQYNVRASLARVAAAISIAMRFASLTYGSHGYYLKAIEAGDAAPTMARGLKNIWMLALFPSPSGRGAEVRVNARGKLHQIRTRSQGEGGEIASN